MWEKKRKMHREKTLNHIRRALYNGISVKKNPTTCGV
jgi:hypothetical protein